MKLIVQLVTWNGVKYVPFLFDSLRKQTFHDWKLFILDNGSTDGMVKEMKKELIDFPVPSVLIESPENTGFAGGHNLLFKKNEGEYVLLLNQDMCLTPDCFERMAAFLDRHRDTASVAPRLMRWDFGRIAEGIATSMSDSLDALGLKVFRNRRMIEHYTKHSWSDVKKMLPRKDMLEVIGVSGAFPMYRRSALEKIAFRNGNFFDESYFMYKEDADVAYRLKSAGYRSFVLLDTVAYHDRSGAGPKEMNDWAAMKNKKNHTDAVRYHSYKNHLMTLYKNEYWQNILLDFPWIFWYEWKKFCWFLLFDRSVLRGLAEIWKQRKTLRERRRSITLRRRLSFREMRAWWGSPL